MKYDCHLLDVLYRKMIPIKLIYKEISN